MTNGREKEMRARDRARAMSPFPPESSMIRHEAIRQPKKQPGREERKVSENSSVKSKIALNEPFPNHSYKKAQKGPTTPSTHSTPTTPTIKVSPIGTPSKSQQKASREVRSASLEHKIIHVLKEALALVSSLGDEDDIHQWFMDHLQDSSIDIDSLQKICEQLSRSLKVHPHTCSSAASTPKSLGTIEDFQQFYFYRTARSMTLLAPMETFTALSSQRLRSKTLGFVRSKGSFWPKVFALPGWTPCVKDHDKLIDCEFWTEAAWKFVDWEQINMAGNGWDKCHGKEIGWSNCSHVECQLMTWYCTNRLMKFTGGEEKPSGKWRKLRQLKRKIEAEIFLSNTPCGSCKKFQEAIEDVTGIKFTFTVVPNLGILVPEIYPGNKQRYYLKTARLEDQPYFHEEQQILLEEDNNGSRARIQVVIPPKSQQERAANIVEEQTRGTKTTKTTGARYLEKPRKNSIDPAGTASKSASSPACSIKNSQDDRREVLMTSSEASPTPSLSGFHLDFRILSDITSPDSAGSTSATLTHPNVVEEEGDNEKATELERPPRGTRKMKKKKDSKQPKQEKVKNKPNKSKPPCKQGSKISEHKSYIGGHNGFTSPRPLATTIHDPDDSYIVVDMTGEDDDSLSAPPSRRHRYERQFRGKKRPREEEGGLEVDVEYLGDLSIGVVATEEESEDVVVLETGNMSFSTSAASSVAAMTATRKRTRIERENDKLVKDKRKDKQQHHHHQQKKQNQQHAKKMKSAKGSNIASSTSLSLGVTVYENGRWVAGDLQK